MVGFRETASVPFPAIVGQQHLKRALLAVTVNDALDGLLIRGEKGTAKSTAVRALVELLPNQRAVADCPYGCPPDDPAAQCASCRDRIDPPVEERPVPLVTLPLGATRERIVGSLSVQDALDGEMDFDPGVLAAANRGFLYVDEVNLLDDHLVDVLLDAAASGINRVERDGMSVTHPAEFTLLGTMNPEEGDLRPQLRDRFALQVRVEGSDDLDERVAIMDTALAPDTTPSTETQHAIARQRNRIQSARTRIDDVTLSSEHKRTIAAVCADADVDGHRADIAAARTAIAFAALEGRETVTEDDLQDALALALPHRLQSRPFEDAPDTEDILEDHFAEGSSTDEASDTQESADSSAEEGANDETTDSRGENTGPNSQHADASSESNGDDADPAPTAPGERTDDGAPVASTRQPASVGDGAAPDVAEESLETTAERTETGRVHTTESPDAIGPRVRTTAATDGDDIDVPASLRSAATDGRSEIESRDLRQAVNAGSAAALIVFAVDASASMRQAFEAAKGTVMDLLRDAYQARDEVAFVAFAGEEAEVLLPPTDSVTLAARHLKDLPTGDRTPLPAGLEAVTDLVETADAPASVAVLVTDGKPNVAEGSPTAATRSAAKSLGRHVDQTLLVDTGDPTDRGRLVEPIVEATDGRRIPIDQLTPTAVRTATDQAVDTD